MTKRTMMLLILFLGAFLLVPMVQAIPEQATQRVIAHTTSPMDKAVYKMNGCTILHELNDATALKCPPGIVIANSEPDRVFHILDLEADQQINADDVWSTGITGSGVTVAVLDTGVDSTHTELSDSIEGGWNFVSENSDYKDDNGHGTHVAGIITANGVDSNAKGVAPNASIWMAKVCDASGSCYTSDIAAAIKYVVDNKSAQVMSMSFGGGGTRFASCDSDYLAIQVNWAYDNGVVTVAAAGNSGTRKVISPACASKAIAVSAVDKNDVFASFSSYGNAVKDHGIAAPGVSIYSTVPVEGYESWYGTSMSTPHVSATVALMLDNDPTLTAAQIRERLFNSANCLGNTYGTCPNIKIGYGRVDALAAIGPAALSPSLAVTATPSTITTEQYSTITATISDIESGVTIGFFEVPEGSFNASSCTTDLLGSCSVRFSSSTPNTYIITADTSKYGDDSTQVIVTATAPPQTCVENKKCNCNGSCDPKENFGTCPADCSK